MFSGKTSIIRYLAGLSDSRLSEITLTETIDATELLGTFEPEEVSTLLESLNGCVGTIRNKLGLLLISSRDASLKNCFDRGFHISSDSDAVSQWLSLLKSQLPPVPTPNDFQNVIHEISRQITAAERLLLLISSNSSKMSFRWIDGQLLQSLERGDWLILRHINFASAAVLDRLNSLLEPNGNSS